MTDKYPLLTVENVKYWYNECNPNWSILDISKATEAPKTTVHRFMCNNGILCRNYSQAQKNRWKCKPKREKELNRIRSKENRRQLSDNMINYLSNKSNYNKWYSRLFNPDKIKLGKHQKVILKELMESGPKFFGELLNSPNLSYLTRSSLSCSLSPLFKRRLITRERLINPNCNNFNKNNYKYFITVLGRRVIADN